MEIEDDRHGEQIERIWGLKSHQIKLHILGNWAVQQFFKATGIYALVNVGFTQMSDVG